MFASERFRLKDPSFIISSAKNKLLELWSSHSTDDFASIYRRIRPYTMLSYCRLRGLFDAVGYVVNENIHGDLVECGSARGGSAALMGLTLRQLGARRTLRVFDTFEGLPSPNEKDPDFEVANQYTGTCRGDIKEVESLFENLGILSDCHLIKGLFQETLPREARREIAVLHIDGDWYDSVKVCLENLYDQVAANGIIQIDDYGYWEGARNAVHDFVRDRGIKINLKYIDYSGRQIVKGAKSEVLR